MKNKIIYLLILCILFFGFSVNVNAYSLKTKDIPKNSYVIGTHLFTRENLNDNYGGTLYAKHIMLGATTIISDNINDMIIYYKDPYGDWSNELTGKNVSMNDEIEIEYKNTVLYLSKPVLNVLYVDFIDNEFNYEINLSNVDDYINYINDVRIEISEITEESNIVIADSTINELINNKLIIKVPKGKDKTITARVYTNEFNDYKNYSDYSNNYILEDTKKVQVSYKVEYYKDNVIDESNTEIITQFVEVENVNKIPVKTETINIKDKYDNYYFVKTEPEILPSEIENDGVIKVYYEEQKDRLYSIKLERGANAILLESNGKYGMIDVGNVSVLKNGELKTGGLSYCKHYVYDYLESLGVKELEFVIATHLHNDHVYCLSGYTTSSTDFGYLLNNSSIKVKKVIMKKYNGTKTTSTDYNYYHRILDIANKGNAQIEYFDGPKSITLGNFNIDLYNWIDRTGDTELNENVNSIVSVLSIKKGDRTSWSYLGADIQNLNDENIFAEDEIASYVACREESGLCTYKSTGGQKVVFDLYVAAHHGYNSSNTPNSIGEGDDKIQFKNALIPNSMSWYCGTYCGTENGCPYNSTNAGNGLYNIYRNLVRNNGNKNLYFSGSDTVIVEYNSDGITISGGEVLSCNNDICSSGSNIYNLIKDNLAQNGKVCFRNGAPPLN